MAHRMTRVRRIVDTLNLPDGVDRGALVYSISHALSSPKVVQALAEQGTSYDDAVRALAKRGCEMVGADA